MSDPDDRIDAWLNAEVEPLAPPPGTFERVRHRAHRRKLRRATLSAAGAAIVIAAAAAAPGIASSLLHSGSGRPERPVAAGTPAPTSRPAVTGSGSGGVNSESSRRVPTPGSSLSATTSGASVPPNFQPTSVTFIGQGIGAVIGQAGTPGHCPIIPADCTSLAGTSDYGTSWYGVSAPVTGAPDGARGVSQVRFLDLNDGWAFGPELWVTHDGGSSWTREKTYGMRVTGLETAGDRAFALFARCAGSGPGYGARCSSVSLYTSLAGTDQWRPVPGPVTGLRPLATSAGTPASASLVLTGGPAAGEGYVLAPSGELLSGPLTGAAWAASPRLPCVPGAPGPGGQPTAGLFAADSSRLVLVCAAAADVTSDTQAKQVYTSADGGAQWSAAGTGPPAGIAASVAVQASDNLVLLATDAGLYRSDDGGATWQLTQASPDGAAAGEHGFSYVGMTSITNGVALPADPGLHEVFISTDGGRTWLAQKVSGP
jgi:hypothetical protein